MGFNSGFKGLIIYIRILHVTNITQAPVSTYYRQSHLL